MNFDYTVLQALHIKFGAEYIHHTFRPGIATSKIQDIDNGALQEDTVYNTSNSHAMRGQEISLYAEDNFNVNARLSLNAGVRTSAVPHKEKLLFVCSPAFPPAMTSDKDILPRHPIRAWHSMCICCPLLRCLWLPTSG